MKQVLLVVVCLFVATAALAQQPTRSEYGLPPGSWSIGCGPRLKRGPVVDLYKTGSSVLTGITVRDIWLENRSKQNVAGVKIAWRVYDTSQEKTTLLQAETPKFLAVPLNAGEKRKVSYPVVSFATVYRPLLHGKKQLEGDYRIEVWVSDVRFTDETAEQGFAAFAHVKKVKPKAGAAAAFLDVRRRKGDRRAVHQRLRNQLVGWRRERWRRRVDVDARGGQRRRVTRHVGTGASCRLVRSLG